MRLVCDMAAALRFFDSNLRGGILSAKIKRRAMQNPPAHYPKHYCGVFGIFGHPNAAELA